MRASLSVWAAVGVLGAAPAFSAESLALVERALSDKTIDLGAKGDSVGEVRVYEDSGHFLEHKLINGELDAALMILSTLENASSFKTTVLVTSPWRLWMSSRHRLTEAETVSLNELRREPVIELRNEELERAAGSLWRRAGFTPRVFARTRSVEATRNFVAAGAGVSLMPQVLFRSWSLDGEQLIARPLNEELPGLEIGVAFRSGTPLSSETEAFLAVARQHDPETAKREL